MKQSDKTMSYLDDILNALKHTAHFIENMSYETFRHDDKTLFALKHAFGIIGQAAKKMPSSLREQYPNIPWREMARMPDKLAYDHIGISQMVLWQTARIDLPALTLALDTMRIRVKNSMG
jgi:uncharacterized protein with HEPN domain